MTTETLRNVRLFGTFTLRSPLSHIGEAISTTSYLVEEPILQPDGEVEPVFSYSGNAWRGQLRDLAASYLLDQLGIQRLPLDAFHLLFSGGRIGGEQQVDLEKARQYRRNIPMLAIFGGGVGNQILPGKLRVSNAYPLCVEALPVLPEYLLERAVNVSYRSLTFEKSFSRKDDSKDDRLNHYAGIGLPEPGQMALLGDGGAEQKTKKEKDGPADQMRMTAELLAAGSVLYTQIDCLDVTEVELGALVSALHRFSRSPHIGGQANKGHGRVALEYRLLDLDTGEIVDFLRVDDGPSKLAPPAEQAKQAYDEFLRLQLDAYLASHQHELRALLGAA